MIAVPKIMKLRDNCLRFLASTWHNFGTGCPSIWLIAKGGDMAPFTPNEAIWGFHSRRLIKTLVRVTDNCCLLFQWKLEWKELGNYFEYWGLYKTNLLHQDEMVKKLSAHLIMCVINA
ncbi:hypothetical protein CDAR_518591 [Caerostris darwini]|uniref:Uncharacterized protein n=1 Tax=Caerostris darwini TaxID=1538125 RepID=A0AAV4UW10_9ARAC|nr:hypothetical protein CDAR_518591 [Caerostris darwini]